MEDVAGRPRLDPFRAEGLSELRHVDLEHLVRARGHRIGPDRLDERLDGDDAPRVEQEAGEERARLADREVDDSAVLAGDLERAEQAEVAHAAKGIIRR